MPRARMTKAQVQSIRRQCQQTFDRALDSCLEDGLFNPNQCLEDAARQWLRCMQSKGVTIRARSTAGETPTRKVQARKAKSKRA